jgi:hypothetical protein
VRLLGTEQAAPHGTPLYIFGTSFFKEYDSILAREPLDTYKALLAAKMLSNAVIFLSSSFIDLEATLQGQLTGTLSPSPATRAPALCTLRPKPRSPPSWMLTPVTAILDADTSNEPPGNSAMERRLPPLSPLSHNHTLGASIGASIKGKVYAGMYGVCMQVWVHSVCMCMQVHQGQGVCRDPYLQGVCRYGCILTCNRAEGCCVCKCGGIRGVRRCGIIQESNSSCLCVMCTNGAILSGPNRKRKCYATTAKQTQWPMAKLYVDNFFRSSNRPAAVRMLDEIRTELMQALHHSQVPCERPCPMSRS